MKNKTYKVIACSSCSSWHEYMNDIVSRTDNFTPQKILYGRYNEYDEFEWSGDTPENEDDKAFIKCDCCDNYINLAFAEQLELKQ